MKGKILTAVMVLSLIAPPLFAQSRMWVTSDNATLKADSKASSATIARLSIGTEVDVVGKEGRWFQVRTVSGQRGWVYGGRLSANPPAKETQENPMGDMLGGLSGSDISSDKASTSRSIRGLSPETEVYAENRRTPEMYKRALDRVLSRAVSDRDVESFLREGQIGEYAP
jgi:uncharacterized protein YgiM (DUF1202 family)